MSVSAHCRRFLFFNDTATTEIYTLSLHDALPICDEAEAIPTGSMIDATRGKVRLTSVRDASGRLQTGTFWGGDRKSTRLNSSHANLVCRLLLEKKKTRSTRVY